MMKQDRPGSRYRHRKTSSLRQDEPQPVERRRGNAKGDAHREVILAALRTFGTLTMPEIARAARMETVGVASALLGLTAADGPVEVLDGLRFRMRERGGA